MRRIRVRWENPLSFLTSGGESRPILGRLSEFGRESHVSGFPASLPNLKPLRRDAESKDEIRSSAQRTVTDHQPESPLRALPQETSSLATIQPVFAPSPGSGEAS
jgi:hypothetical protein